MNITTIYVRIIYRPTRGVQAYKTVGENYILTLIYIHNLICSSICCVPLTCGNYETLIFSAYRCLYISGLLSPSDLKLICGIISLAGPLYGHRLIATPQTIQDNGRTERMRTYIHVLSAIRTRKPNLQQAKSRKPLSSRGLCDQSARMRDTQYTLTVQSSHR